MTAASINIFLDSFNPARLFGPIFDKELRVASRRRRNYFLRSGYVILLSFFILSVWYSIIGIRSSGTSLYQVSRFSQLGRGVIISFVWFQFVVAQLIAIVMLSSSISDEIHTGTLSVLLTTPINSFQIVTGKLLSKLLQLILLLAISLPLLAIIRIFGGVPWNFIVSSICITATATFFAGALSLLLSMTYRYAYSVILVIIVAYLLAFGVLPGLATWLAAKGFFSQQATQSVLALTNPFWALYSSTQTMSLFSGQSLSLPRHCLIMLFAASVLSGISVWRVRNAVLCEAFGKPGRPLFRQAVRKKGKNEMDHAGSIKRVTGSPIVWKEMYKGFLGPSKTDKTIIILLITLSFLAAILLLLSPRNNAIFIFPSYLISGIYLIVMIRLAISTAGSIASEKESRTWHILLVSPLEDKEIIRGKIIAAVWRNLPLLLLYLLLVCITYFRMGVLMSPQIFFAIPFAIVGLAGSILFMVGTGSYFGVRFKTTTAAIAATVGSYLVLRYLFCGVFNPLRFMLLNRIMSSRTSLLVISFAMMVIPTFAMGGIGIFLAWRASRRLRRDII